MNVNKLQCERWLDGQLVNSNFIRIALKKCFFVLKSGITNEI